MCSNRTVHLALNDALCPSSRRRRCGATGRDLRRGHRPHRVRDGNSSNGGFTGNTGGFN
jgi:hypothetical protein